MLFAGPSIVSHAIIVYRKDDTIDGEGMPSQDYTILEEFRGGFGSVSVGKQLYVGTPAQKVDAAISTLFNTTIQVNDKVNVNGRDWKCLGVYSTANTIRILLSHWGVR